PLLAEARDRAGESDRDNGVEQADVDAELERVRRGDADELARRQALLDLSPLGRRVAGAVGGQPARLAEAVGGGAVGQLPGPAALGKEKGGQVARDGAAEPARALAEWRGAEAESP